MPRPHSTIPPYLHHASGQARTRVRLADGRTRDLYLGRYDSPESREEYRRVVALVAQNGGVYPAAATAGVTLAEALVGYVREADGFYRDADGNPTRGLEDVRRFARLLRVHADVTIPAVEFTPARLKGVQQGLAAKYVRIQVNKFMVQARRFARWSFLEDLIPLELCEKLRAVPGLRAGRAGVKEGKRRRAADPAAVEKVLPALPPALAAAVRVMRWSGARPSEILNMRAGELETAGDVWRFRPPQHKGAWRNRERLIFIGPEAAGVLRPLLEGLGPDDFVFSPRRAESARNAERAAARVTPRWPSHTNRNELKRKGSRAGAVYTVNSAGQALKRACEKAGVTPFTLYELRHLRASELVELGGVELARAALGHSHAAMTGHYARAADAGLGERAARIGPAPTETTDGRDGPRGDCQDHTPHTGDE